MEERRLDALIRAAADATPAATAVMDPERGTSVSYRELCTLTDSVARSLEDAGVRPDDRVGIAAPKSVASVAAVLGVLRAGAAYVPVDATAPAARNAFIFRDCAVRAVLADPALAADLAAAGEGTLSGKAEVDGLAPAGARLVRMESRSEAASPVVPEGLAYVLYTSGSTGRPKGVMHTHASALAFVDWCTETFDPRATDRFTSHAPFHFDLSIHDLYVPLMRGATLVLIGERVGKQPLGLAELVAAQGITVWYSTPSILRLMAEFGRMRPEDYQRLRIVHFAGEVFPVKHLRALKAVWEAPRYFNLYGPTETNVCTYFEIPTTIPDDRTEPFPIGRPCSGDECKVVDQAGAPVPEGDEGELLVAGGSVMPGYFNLPERTDAAFVVDEDGRSWYRTGDVVRDTGGQCYDFVGRRDRMVKRRGYRVELGEIEAALYRHPDVSEAAVVAVPDDTTGLRIQAFVAWRGEDRPSLIRMKRFCSEQLPLYMVPDGFAFPDALPKTSTDKVDYQRLAELGG